MKPFLDKYSDSLPVSELNLAGSHNSCAVNVNFGYFSKCQHIGIYDQLKAGARVLDIRVKAKGDKLNIVHGITNCRKSPLSPVAMTIGDVAEDCKKFLGENPTETVIMLFNRDIGDKDVSKMLEKYTDDFWFTENRIPTLGEVRGKIVLVNRFPSSDDHTGGINLTAWSCSNPVKTDFKKTDIALRSGDGTVGKMLIQDDYALPPHAKWHDAVRPTLDAEVGEGIVFNYLSANDARHSVKMCARYVNGEFFKYKLIEDKKYGWLMFDHFDEAIAEKYYGKE